MLSILASILVAVATDEAHPGSGLEVTADGTVYVADVARETIWRVSPDGDVSPAVTHSWTHEFHLSANDALVFEKEHTGYEQAPQSIWTLEPGARDPVRVVAPPDDRSKFGSTAFARAADGSVRFMHTVRGEDNKWYALIRQREADDVNGSRVRTIAGCTRGEMYRDGPADQATFRMIVDMRLMDDGTLYLLDRDRLRVLSSEGQVTTRGPALIDAAPVDPPTHGGPATTWNRLYGLAIDPDGNALIAYNAGRRVMQITPDGTLTTIHSCDRGWAPLGVAIGPGGELHVSEASDRGNRLRILRFTDDKSVVLASIPAE